MIVQGGNKTQQYYDGEDRVYMVFVGEDLVYNCYCKLEDEHIYLSNDGSYLTDVKSNTEWKINNI